jgi:hypothetical protein
MLLLSYYELDRSFLPLIQSSLQEFVEETSNLYRDSFIRINIHQLLHLIDDIESWGLLWTHNSFIYESMNGILMKFIHGTQSVPKAAIHALNCLQQMKFKEFNISFREKEASILFQKFQKESFKYIF